MESAKQRSETKNQRGFVWFVCVDVHHAQWMPLKAKECLEQAEVVVTNQPIPPSLLPLVPAGAEVVMVQGNNTSFEHQLVEAICAKVREGKRVVRLLFGDPFLFGDGLSELQELLRRDVPLDFVPTGSSLSVAAAFAGIPLIADPHNADFAIGLATSEKSTDFRQLAPAATIVALTSLSRTPAVAQQLLAGGKAPSTLAAAIVQAKPFPRQVTVAPLSEWANLRLTSDEQVVFVVGEGVKWREQLSWWRQKPLWGQRILTIRTEEQIEGLASRLEELGAEVIRLPLIRIAPPEDEAPLETALSNALAGRYDWIVFTSVNGVRTFFDRVRRRGKDARAFAAVRFAVIGPATGEALEHYGIRPDAMPDRYTNEGLADMFAQYLSGTTLPVRFLLWRAQGAREVLKQRLQEGGAIVDEVAAYRTVPNFLPIDYLEGLLREPVHIVTFTSPSTVSAFFEVLGEGKARTVLEQAAVAVIGPVTEQACRRYQVSPTIVAEEHTMGGLVSAIVRWVLAKNFARP